MKNANIIFIKQLGLQMGKRNNLYTKVKNLKRIKSKETILKIFDDIKNEITKNNYKKIFFMLLKKTTHKHLKVFFLNLLFEYFEISKFMIEESMIDHKNRIIEKVKILRENKKLFSNKKGNELLDGLENFRLSTKTKSKTILKLNNVKPIYNLARS